VRLSGHCGILIVLQRREVWMRAGRNAVHHGTLVLERNLCRVSALLARKVGGGGHHGDQRRVLAVEEHIWRWPLSGRPRTCAGRHRWLRSGHDLGDAEPVAQGTLNRAKVRKDVSGLASSSFGGHGHLRTKGKTDVSLGQATI
jgi:hypothetical protein